MIMEVPRKTFSESDLSFTCLKSLYIKEGRENQMLTLIIVLFCHAKVGVGDELLWYKEFRVVGNSAMVHQARAN